MTVEKPPIILADWNEERGPLIIDSIFPEKYQDMDDSPEVLVTRCYINAQSIFARAEFSKINFSIPMVSIKKLAIVFFDVVPDRSEEHTSELQSRPHLVCRLLLEKK